MLKTDKDKNIQEKKNVERNKSGESKQCRKGIQSDFSDKLKKSQSCTFFAVV